MIAEKQARRRLLHHPAWGGVVILLGLIAKFRRNANLVARKGFAPDVALFASLRPVGAGSPTLLSRTVLFGHCAASLGPCAAEISSRHFLPGVIMVSALDFSLAFQWAEMHLDSLRPARTFVAVANEYAVTRARVGRHFLYLLGSAAKSFFYCDS